MFLRETFIALRARRTAYRVAAHFLFPHMRSEGTQLPLPPVNREEAESLIQLKQEHDRAREEEARAWRQSLFDLRFLLFVLFVILMFALLIALGVHVVPATTGR
jgi:hypothetical protein